MSIFKKEENEHLLKTAREWAVSDDKAKDILYGKVVNGVRSGGLYDWLIGNGVNNADMLKVGTAKADPKNPITVETINKISDAMFIATTDKRYVAMANMAKGDPRLIEEQDADPKGHHNMTEKNRFYWMQQKGSKWGDLTGSFNRYLNRLAGSGAGGSRTANSFEDRHKKASANMVKAVIAAEKSNSNAERESYDAELLTQYREDLKALDALAAKIEKSKVLPTEE